jgi:hypothetical protein
MSCIAAVSRTFRCATVIDLTIEALSVGWFCIHRREPVVVELTVPPSFDTALFIPAPATGRCSRIAARNPARLVSHHAPSNPSLELAGKIRQ